MLEYRYIDDDHIDFSRTFVPVSMRGKGIARELVLHGLSWARNNHLDIHASCWYVRRVMSAGKS